MTEYYDCLGLTKEASEKEIKKAYYKYAKLYHPDKSNDKESEEKFKQCSEAHEVLSNPEKRKLYDRYGKKGLEQKGIMRRKTPNIEVILELTMDELYHGVRKTITYERKTNCQSCDGKGTLTTMDVTCNQCKGQGQTLQMQRAGNMMFQTAVVCPLCLGKGYKIDEKDQCKTCKGERFNEENKALEIDIGKGMVECVLVYHGESHIITDMIAGDVHITIKILPSDYERRGNDLIFHKKISFLESIGKPISINHFGKVIHIKAIIQPHSTKKLVGYGIPILNTTKYGDLYIIFDVVYDFTDKQIIQLKKLLNYKDLLLVDTIDLQDATIPSENEPEFNQPQCVQQ